VEPIQGNGGVVIPPNGFLRGLREIASEAQALLIFDEIQCGFGRSGRMWALEHEAVVPDLLTTGKGIGGGLPIAAVIGSDDVMTTFSADAVTSTFLSNALTQAAAVATIDVMVEENLVERSRELGESALQRLHDALRTAQRVGDIRGRGLFIGLELVEPGPDRRPDPALAERSIARFRDMGLIVGRGGRYDNVLKLSPPLTISEGELFPAVDRIAEELA
jgi:4-aminobutyrate aminotransferase / (S)-3-amino-2-methylpropionate transaminase / 5-aminovalerate transaminase